MAAGAAEASALGLSISSSTRFSQTDIRPTCSGEVWRRMVGKSLLSTEIPTLTEYLCPHQLAVAVKAGSEYMALLGRQWFKKH